MEHTVTLKTSTAHISELTITTGDHWWQHYAVATAGRPVGGDWKRDEAKYKTVWEEQRSETLFPENQVFAT